MPTSHVVKDSPGTFAPATPTTGPQALVSSTLAEPSSPRTPVASAAPVPATPSPAALTLSSLPSSPPCEHTTAISQGGSSRREGCYGNATAKRLVQHGDQLRASILGMARPLLRLLGGSAYFVSPSCFMKS